MCTPPLPATSPGIGAQGRGKRTRVRYDQNRHTSSTVKGLKRVPRRFSAIVRERCWLLMLVGMMLTVGVPTVAAAPMPATSSTVSPLGDTAAEQFANMYSPIAYVRQQAEPCDRKGEAYLPAPVEIVLGDPAVALKRDAGGKRADDPVIKMAPTAQDLAGKGAEYYLDLPGDPRAPGCTYEQDAKARMAGHQPTTYAHIVAEPEHHRLTMQYWFYTYFDDFNNTHESDWEMIQLRFDASSVEEALTQEPVSVAYAQHGSGETAGWHDTKLQREGNHPFVYPAVGSHATFYANNVYLSWGENGSGFGCDDTRTPSIRTPLQAVVLPDAPDPSGPFGWLLFAGRWGEREPGPYNGPKSPNISPKWDDPVGWQESLRPAGVVVPESDTLGPAPTDFFCTVAQVASRTLTYFGAHPLAVGGLLTALVAAFAWMVSISRRFYRPAWLLYRKQRRAFVRIGLAVIPISLLFNGFAYLVTTNPPIRWAVAWFGNTVAARFVSALIVGGIQQLAMVLLVAPAIIQVMRDDANGIYPGFRRAFRMTLTRMRVLASAFGRAVVVIGLLSISIVGLPWALWFFVRWGFFAQAAILDGMSTGKAAIRRSDEIVRGRWWQTLGIGAIFAIIAAVPGPIIGLLLLIVLKMPVELVNALGSLIYVITIPFGVIGYTLLYVDLRDHRQPALDATTVPARPAIA